MIFMEILEELFNKKYLNYKGLSLLKNLIATNSTFKEKLKYGIDLKKVIGFDEEVFDKIRAQNIRRISSFEDVFKDGANIGYCTVAVKQLSYSYDGVKISGGTVPFLKGTTNSIDGSHTWMVFNGKVYDTSLMLIMDEVFAKNIFNYNEENFYDPMIDPIYVATKEFTCDTSLSNNRIIR